MPKVKAKIKRVFGKLIAFVKHPFNRKNEPMLHTIEWIFILLAFFAVGMPVLYYQSAENLYGGGKLTLLGDLETPAPPTEAEKKFIGEEVPQPIDTAGWSTYRNRWYGFEIQHPNAWTNNTQYKTATEKSARYEIIYKFRKDGENANDTFEGYDVKAYSAKKVPNIESTNDIHRKQDAPENTSSCALSEETDFGPEGFHFQKVSIEEDNPCFEPAYFFSVSKGGYIYNIVPAVGKNGERFTQPEKETTKIFPEYKEAVASLKLIPISRPLAVPAKPKITAKRPVSAKVVGGKLVCAKKKDKPRKSKKNKPGHLDLECCLDPDEKPNPWCTY